jgi:hypothetical protein
LSELLLNNLVSFGVIFLGLLTGGLVALHENRKPRHRMEMDEDQISKYYHVHTVKNGFGEYLQYPCWMPGCNE